MQLIMFLNSNNPFHNKPTIQEKTKSLKSCCAHYILKNKINYTNKDEVIYDCISYIDKIQEKYSYYYEKEETED